MNNARNQALFRKNILSHLQQFVYGPFDDFYERELTEIVELNDAQLGGRTYRFRYMGEIFDQPNIRVTGKRPKVYPLFPEFHERLQKVLDEKRLIDDNERPFVMNYLTRVLTRAPDTVSAITALPCVLRRPFAQFIKDNNLEAKELSIDETGEAVGACEKSLALLKQRLMLNLLLGDR
ncbi:MAG: hypothetical protein J6N20_20515 [Pseudomonas sp.]|nr:hypothetical protein [Pseudomonas sp.]